MDQLLVIPIHQSLPEETLSSLKLSGWQVTVADDLAMARQILQQGHVSVLMIEFSLANQDPERLKLLRFVQQHCPATLVTMLHSLSEDEKQVEGDVLAGAVNSIEDARHGAARNDVNRLHLSPAQVRIADLVAQAWPNREIARRLKIKEQSVRNEVSRIFRKVGVWNRVELALLINHRPRTAEPPNHANGADAARLGAEAAAISSGQISAHPRS
ncbi:MAG: LuxR C-terminal-related transcriptional regulator [Terriglobales bacterium]